MVLGAFEIGHPSEIFHFATILKHSPVITTLTLQSLNGHHKSAKDLYRFVKQRLITTIFDV
jgi:hypothetical protein